MGVSPGSPVSAGNTNNAFLDSNGDDTGVGKYALENTDAASGPFAANIQAQMNGRDTFMGRILNSGKDSLPAWVSTALGTSIDDLMTRVELLTRKFATTHTTSDSHDHSGAAGQAEQITSVNIAGVKLSGVYPKQTNLTGVTGTSTNVTTQLTGETPSTSDTIKGIVVNAPYNQSILKYASGAFAGDDIISAGGNLVYGRITESSGTWTQSYFEMIAGVETAYSFASTDIAWYPQKLFNPITDKPAYSDLLYVPSGNATETVLDASGSQRGVVSTGTQTFAGQKIFLNNPILDALASGGILFLTSLKVITQDTARLFWDQVNFRLGLGTGSPNTTLDVNGDVSVRWTSQATAASITAMATPTSSIRFTGSTATDLHGITSGFNGKVLYLLNLSSATVTIKNQSGSASAADRIQTSTGADVLLPPNFFAALQYDESGSRWYLNGPSGVASFSKTSGTKRYGNVSLTEGSNVTITDNGDGTFTIASSGGGSSTAPKVTTYASGSGTHTFTGSPLYVRVRMVGGGGGGSGSGTATGTASGGGGDSTFGTSLLSAGGGGGGAFADNGGTGGTSSLGSGPVGIALPGGTGHGAQYGNNVTSAQEQLSGGSGAASHFGGSGGGASLQNNGQAGKTNTGGGGGGGGGNATSAIYTGSGGGSGGFVDAIIEGATLSGLSGSAAYSVGAAGGSGGAGTSGYQGGQGGSGFIEVTEFYQ